jgi:hypothetical protein
MATMENVRARGEGLEPPLPGSEPGVLPLNEPRVGRRERDRTADLLVPNQARSLAAPLAGSGGATRTHGLRFMRAPLWPPELPRRGTPGRTRTAGPQHRRLVLSPSELRARGSPGRTRTRCLLTRIQALCPDELRGQTDEFGCDGTRGRTRTCNGRINNPRLYQLSYPRVSEIGGEGEARTRASLPPYRVSTAAPSPAWVPLQRRRVRRAPPRARLKARPPAPRERKWPPLRVGRWGRARTDDLRCFRPTLLPAELPTVGGPARTRTARLLGANEALFLLSYRPGARPVAGAGMQLSDGEGVCIPKRPCDPFCHSI